MLKKSLLTVALLSISSSIFAQLGGLNEGDRVESAPLENRLLLLSDLPGVNVKSTLLPGATVGTSDLVVGLTPGRRVSGEVDFDNAGNRYTGEYRLGAMVNLNNPLGLGDVASLRAITSSSGLNYARASYQLVVGKATAGSLYGDHRDGWGGGGLTGYSLTWTVGNIDMLTSAARAIDAATAKTQGHFGKLEFTAMRLQRVTDALSLYGSINGQFASKNLDSSERMELGGIYAVRAYPEGEGYGDEGYVLNLEARLQLPNFSAQQLGRVQLIGFVDGGQVTLHKNPWTPGTKRRSLSGAGMGLVWSDPNDFLVRTYYAAKLGSEDATSDPDKSGRFWMQGVKYF